MMRTMDGSAYTEYQKKMCIRDRYSDRMYQYYTGIADSVGNLSSNTYQYATDVQEVRRYLKGVTGCLLYTSRCV